MTKVDGIRQSELTQSQKAELQKVEYGKEYIEPSWLAIGGALATGTVASSFVKTTGKLSASYFGHKFMDCSKYSKTEAASIFRAANKGLAQAGLAKDVKILKATPKQIPTVEKALLKEVNSNWFTKLLPERFKKFLVSGQTEMFATGKNAAYVPGSKKIIMPADKLSGAVFHEIGHAKNANLSKIGKLLQKGIMLPLLAAPIALIALWKTKKAEGEQATGVVDKTTDFIKNNAGKLTFATFLPMLIEEAMATFKGNKMAKTFLKPELFKKIAKGNALAYMTYLLGAVATGAGVFVATKVKDSIASRKEVEFANDDIGKIDKENYYKLRQEEIQKFDLNGNGKIDEGKEQKYYQAWKLAKVS